MEISLFQPEDLLACLAIFDSNTPDYFAVQEQPGFAHFLGRLPDSVTYLVVRDKHRQIIACGGYKLVVEQQRAKLRWDMVHRSYHRQGVGRWFTQYRLEQAFSHPAIKIVQVGTSQYSAGFYERVGFSRVAEKKDGITPGFDEVLLEYRRKEAHRG